MKNKDDLINYIKEIVKRAKVLSDEKIEQKDVVVNYACIFSQSLKEFKNLKDIALNIGEGIHETKTGPVYKINTIETIAGPLKILKIRHPDPTRTQLGDADFIVNNFEEFKNSVINKKGFKLIERPNMQMLEISDPEYNILTYYSNPILAKVIGVEI